ncbi:DUF2007 domain-containing protein [Hyphobacterium sp. HN65]|uniref:DUF2007 domain-containing protein n=1 Tax=Hyphobacterium lacteum TaxID=3116575 RepID=A0ABU7LMI5_9PROT|nr:DUF2007 domain-containing protein [Hyphobacterium sp. HN65]MEE2525140.1 DUF2007 domain-containing protein [Hyphobacterium sp. HN65]
MDRMVQIADFWSAGEAATAVSALRAAGIPAICPDYHSGHYLPYFGMGATACRVMVPEPDLDLAESIIGVKPDSEYRLNPCPECGGNGLQKRNWLITLPYMFWMLITGSYGYGNRFWLQDRRKCMSCGHEWLPDNASNLHPDDLQNTS